MIKINWVFLMEVSFYSAIVGGVALMFCGESPLPLPPDLEVFKKLIASSGKRKGGHAQKFVKKVDIPYVELPTDKTCRSTLNLA